MLYVTIHNQTHKWKWSVLNIKVYESTTTNHRKTLLNFLRESVKNIPPGSQLYEGIKSKQNLVETEST